MSHTNQDPSVLDDLKARLWEKLDQLPQRDAIEMSDARQWIDFMATVMPKEAMWHMIRAGGFGGSEIGVLVQNFMGKPGDFNQSAAKLTEEKLFRRTPSTPKGVMARGHFMEPLTASMLYQELDAGRDEHAFKALRSAKNHPWMRYSPDDMIRLNKPVEINAESGSETISGLILVDYKAPTSISSDPLFSYQCQLHQGFLLAQEHEIDVQHTMLTEFDWANFALSKTLIEIDDRLCELIPQAGSHYWDFVLRGEIPEHVRRPQLTLDEKASELWAPVAERLGQLGAMKSALEKEFESLKNALVAGLSLDENRIGSQSLKFPGAIAVSSIRKVNEAKVLKTFDKEVIQQLAASKNAYSYDQEAMIARLQELGENPEAFRKPEKLDAKKLDAFLAKQGLDPDEFMRESVAIRVDRNMSQQAQDWVNASFPELPIPGRESKIESVVEHFELDQEEQQSAPRSRPRSVM